MLAPLQFFGTYGVQSTFYFMLEDVTATDAPFVGIAPVTGDIWIVKDGGAPANATNGATAEGNGIYSLVLTATEMQAEWVCVSIYDATPLEIFKPGGFFVNTKLRLGQMAVNASQYGGNADGIRATACGTGGAITGDGGAGAGYGIVGASGATGGGGVVAFAAGGNAPGFSAAGAGTKAGIETTGGATGQGLYAVGGSSSGAGIEATTQAGNSSGIKATGRGTGYGLEIAHASTATLLHTIFNLAEPAEPSSAFAAGDTVIKGLQLLIRRFYNKVTQTSSQQIVYKDDSSTAVATETCSDDGTTQTKGRAT